MVAQLWIFKFLKEGEKDERRKKDEINRHKKIWQEECCPKWSSYIPGKQIE
jgi:hypothetical protein